MSQHMVIFQNPDGDPGYNQFESIEGAVSFVEKLRNEQGIDSIRIFELEEVKFDLKPIYKVELQALTSGSAPSAPAPATASAPPPTAPAPAPAPAPAGEPTPPPSPESTSGSPFAPPSGPSEPASAPTPPADQPPADEDGQPARRGLFGR